MRPAVFPSARHTELQHHRVTLPVRAVDLTKWWRHSQCACLGASFSLFTVNLLLQHLPRHHSHDPSRESNARGRHCIAMVDVMRLHPLVAGTLLLRMVPSRRSKALRRQALNWSISSLPSALLLGDFHAFSAQQICADRSRRTPSEIRVLSRLTAATQCCLRYCREEEVGLSRCQALSRRLGSVPEEPLKLLTGAWPIDAAAAVCLQETMPSLLRFQRGHRFPRPPRPNPPWMFLGLMDRRRSPPVPRIHLGCQARLLP